MIGELRSLAALLPDVVVALDYDGTLAPIVARPDDARPLPEAAEVVRALAPRVRRLAVITGRPAGFVVSGLGLEPTSPVLVLGAYGAERWSDGRLEPAEVPSALARARPEVEALVRAAPEGVRLEDKVVAVAVHTRGAASPDEALAALRGPLDRLAATHGLRVEPGRLVVELRGAGGDKGSALRALLDAERPRGALMAGDDLGDVPAFSEVRRWAQERRGEDPQTLGVAVCSGSDEAAPEVRAATDVVVDGPAGVARLLAGLLEGPQLA